jgi:hypothetical protein
MTTGREAAGWHRTRNLEIEGSRSLSSARIRVTRWRPGMTTDVEVASVPEKTEDMNPRFRGALCPSFSYRPPSKSKRAQGRPGARCTLGRVCRKSTRVSNQGYTGSSGLPCAMVLRLIRALLGDHRLVATVVGVMRSIIANLAPASERQNHTTSPSASAPFVSVLPASTASRALRP